MDFFFPYLNVVVVIARALVQNVENVLPDLIFFGIGYQYSIKIAILGLIILFLLVVVSLLFQLWKWSRYKVFPIMLLLTLGPGFFSVLGMDILPDRRMEAGVFTSGGGTGLETVGNIEAGVYFSVLLMALGWNLMTFLIKVFPKSKAILDHVWYSVGILSAIVFLIEDNGRKITDFDISKTIQEISFVKERIKKQDIKIQAFMSETNFINDVLDTSLNEAKKFAWQADRFNNYYVVYPKSELDSIKIRQINSVICSHETYDKYCERIPYDLSVLISNYGNFSAFNELDTPKFIYLDILLNTVHFATKKLNRLYEIKRFNKIDSYRWFAILILSIIAGAKIAVATNSIFRN